MEDEPDRTANAAGLNTTDALIQKLIDAFGGSAGASLVYGDAVDRGGITVIPVAKVGFGFGFGRNNEKGKGGRGGGLGAVPIGHIEIRNGVARFRRLSMTPAYVILQIVLTLAAILFLASAMKRNRPDA